MLILIDVHNMNCYDIVQKEHYHNIAVTRLEYARIANLA